MSSSSSSSMESPSLIILWMRPANSVGCSRVNPLVSRAVSYISQIRSLTVLSFLSASVFLRSSMMMTFLGLISMVFLLTM